MSHCEILTLFSKKRVSERDPFFAVLHRLVYKDFPSRNSRMYWGDAWYLVHKEAIFFARWYFVVTSWMISIFSQPVGIRRLASSM